MTKEHCQANKVFNRGGVFISCGWDGYKCTVADCHYFDGAKTPFSAADHLGVEGFSHAAWADLLAQTVDSITKLGREKGGEYAGDHDRLANFRRNAAATGVSMELVWRIYAGKHYDAITQFIKDLQTGKERLRMETLASRADDLIVYLILFKAMLIERGVK
jgi:hypothetical protein